LACREHIFRELLDSLRSLEEYGWRKLNTYTLTQNLTGAALSGGKYVLFLPVELIRAGK